MSADSLARRPVLRALRTSTTAALLTLAQHAVCAPQFHLAWESGFERGVPGEWHPYDDGSWSPSGTMPAGRVAAWTIVSRSSGEPVYGGTHAYRGWITGRSNTSHRAYPVIQAADPDHIPKPIPSPLVNSFMVWLDCDYAAMEATEWIHLATWANNPEWKVHTMSVRDRKLELAHVVPFHGEYIGPLPRPDFPLRRWVRMTAYIEYSGAAGFVQVWQDGVPMLRARVTASPGSALLRAHWGLYAPSDVSGATMYNDDIRIWTLSAPLADLAAEPLPRP